MFPTSAFSVKYPAQRAETTVRISADWPLPHVLQAALYHLQGVQLKNGQYFNMSNLFTKIYMLYYTTNLYLQ